MAAIAPSSRLLRVYLVEPQPLFAKALFRILSDEENVSVAGEGRTFDPEAIIKSGANVVLVDWDASPSDVHEAVRGWRNAVRNVRICILSTCHSPTVMMRAISAGADGYVLKDITPAELVNCIRTLATNGFYADPRLTGILLRSRATETAAHLSRRELDVVRLIAEGLSNKQIADRLLLSDKTVKNHIANIFSKLDVCARTQIAVYAIRNGIV